MAKCTDAERAFLDAIDNGTNPIDARVAVKFECVTREAPELLQDLCRLTHERRRIDNEFQAKWKKLDETFFQEVYRSTYVDKFYDFVTGTW